MLPSGNSKTSFILTIEKHKYPAIFCCCAAFFYILPLLIANIYYIDDLRRSLNGIGWNYDGRPLASFLMHKFTAGRNISDYFPYSTIFSAAIVAIAGYIVCLVLEIEKGVKYKFSALILLINPFYLENLSYRWDSLPMAISVIAVIFPFLYISSRYLFVIFSIIGILTTMLTYQASIAIYPLMAILLLLKHCFRGANNKELLNCLIVCITSFVLGLILYKISNLVLSFYSGDRDTFILFKADFVSNLLSNCKMIGDLVKTAFSRYFSLLIMLSAFVCLIAYIKQVLSSNTIINKILIPILSALVIVFIPFVLLVLKDPWVTPRVLIGFSFLLYLILIFVNDLSGKLASILACLFIFISLALMSSYANALKSQNNLEVFVAQKIAETVDVNNKTLAFDGKLELAEDTHVAVQKFPILNRLVPSYMNNNWVWGGRLFMKANNQMYSPVFPLEDEYYKLIKNKLSLPIIEETRYYTLRADSVTIIVDFNKSR